MAPDDKSDNYAAAVATQLFQTQNLIHTLLTEIRESSSSQAGLSAELRQLRINVNTLSNIIRGDDGNTKPIVMEVELLKRADLGFEKRMSECEASIEEQVISLGRNLSGAVERFQGALEGQRKELEAKIDLADKQEREYETAKLHAQALESNDLRLDRRSRFQTWAGIVIAVISLGGSIAAILLK